MSMLPAALAVLGLAAAAPTPLRLPADVDDVYALDANPGGLGFLEGGELRVLYARDDLDFLPAARGPTDGFGVYGGGRFGPLSFAGAVDIDVDGLDRTGYRLSLGSALRGRSLSLGLSFDHLRRPGGEDADTRFNLGLAYRVTSWLAAGVSVRDLAQTVDRRRWDLGLALRPFDWLVFSARWRLTQSQPLNGDTYDVAGLLTVAPLSGLRIGAGVERSAALDWAVTGQVAVDFGRFGLGAAILRADDRPGLVTELVFRGREHPNLLPRSGVAVVDVQGSLTPPATFSLLGSRVRVSPYGDLPLMLAALSRSEQVDGVYVRIGAVDAGWAKAREVREGLRALRASGRRVDCQLGGAGDVAYYIATACTTILVPPPSVVRADGVAANLLFFGDLMDRIGLQPQVVRRGKYKSSPEQFTRNAVSPAQREALGAFLDDVYAELVGAVAEGRRLDAPTVEGLIDLAAHTSSQAVARKLVDRALYPDEIEEFLRQQYGRQPHLQPAESLAEAAASTWGRRPRIAIVYVDAAITGGESQDLPFGLGQTVGARTLAEALDALRTDPGVEGVVLRVDSPGGESVASDLIARAVARLDEVKPVIASFGDVAASGGYYVAAPARAIYAEPTTLTGSIGVFSLGVSAERLLTKLGIGVSQLERGRFSAAQTPFEDWTPEEEARVDEMVEHFYQRFLKVVADGRDMKVEAVHAVAQGRIWSGADAKAVGLVDELGGFMAAIRRAKAEAGLDPDAEVELEVYPQNRRPLPAAVQTLAEALGPSAPSALEVALRRLLPAGLARQLAPLIAAASARGPLAMLPFGLDVD